jgi:hypothetical protein
MKSDLATSHLATYEVECIAMYRQHREKLLTNITQQLAADSRFVAAWLTGSLGRGEADEVSDIDVTLVVTEAHVESLCARPWQVSGRTTPPRLALFSQFGQLKTSLSAHGERLRINPQAM